MTKSHHSSASGDAGATKSHVHASAKPDTTVISEQPSSSPLPKTESHVSQAQESKKKWLLIGLVIVTALIVIGGVGAASYRSLAKPAPTPTPAPEKKRVVEPVNVISVAERPVVLVSPNADRRSVTLTITEVKKAADSVEYELDYQSGELLQGVSGAIDLAILPASTTQLMGTCSAGGRCSYHENVQGGTVLLRFKGVENYSVKQDWRYITNTTKSPEAASRDAKFQINSPALAKERILIIYNSPGYPSGLEGEVLSDPYALQASSPLSGKAALTLRSQSAEANKIAGWDGTAWQYFDVTAEDKTLTAEVDLLPLYVAVKQ